MKAKSFEQQILDWLARPDYQPLKQHELARVLAVENRLRFRHVLYALERAGRIVCLRKNRWALPPPAKQRPAGAQAPRAAEALQSSVAVGILMRDPQHWYVLPDNPRRLRHNIRVREFAPSIQPTGGHKVVVRLDAGTQLAGPFSGMVIEDLGRADAPGVDVLSIIRGREFATDFPLAVRRPAAPPTQPPPPALRANGRHDLRDLITFTIDPDDAKDFDDAISLVALPGDRWQLGVHIADVAHYVTMDSPIDREARTRGNTIYLVDRAISMLPQHLTSDVCSLVPHQDRLTHTALLIFNRQLHLEAAETFPSVICSAARLTYAQAEAVFAGKGALTGIPDAVCETLSQLRPLARKWRTRRLAAGALNLAVPEVKCILDEHGHVSEIRPRGDDEAYQLIEECMLLANVAVAERLRAAGGPALYRIHDEPDEEQWEQMRMDLQAVGVPVVPATPADLNKLLLRLAGKPLAPTLNLMVVRNLKRAIYSAELRPHFGLAFPRYTHFTSPIRRYPDLVIHRLLTAVERGEPPPYSKSALARLATHCSATERAADEAENESVEVKRVAFYQEKLRRGDVGPFAGVVTGLLNRGVLVELRDSLQRGLLPFAALKSDYYVLNPTRTQARGKRRRMAWRIGQPVEVLLARVDTANRWLDFALPT